MNKKQNLKLIEIRDCKKFYLELAEKYGKKKELIELYNAWEALFYKGVLAKFSYIRALDESEAARKAVKIDPYIAGGAAQAIGGAGVGVYSAFKAEEHNKEIDKARFNTYMAEREAERNDKSAEEQLWTICEAIMNLLDTMPESKEITKKFLDRVYEVADELEKQGKTEEAIQKFEFLNGYKDSVQRIDDIKAKKFTNRMMKVCLSAFAFAILITLCAMLEVPDAWALFPIILISTFIVSFFCIK